MWTPLHSKCSLGHIDSGFVCRSGHADNSFRVLLSSQQPQGVGRALAAPPSRVPPLNLLEPCCHQPLYPDP